MIDHIETPVNPDLIAILAYDVQQLLGDEYTADNGVSTLVETEQEPLFQKVEHLVKLQRAVWLAQSEEEHKAAVIKLEQETGYQVADRLVELQEAVELSKTEEEYLSAVNLLAKESRLLFAESDRSSPSTNIAKIPVAAEGVNMAAGSFGLLSVFTQAKASFNYPKEVISSVVQHLMSAASQDIQDKEVGGDRHEK